MCKRKKTPQELMNDPEKIMRETMQERRDIRKSHQDQYNDARDVIMEEIENNQGTDIMEHMLKDRREWLYEQKELNMGKFPKDCKGFYDRFKTEAPKAEGEGDDDDDDGKKDKKKKKGEKKKKGKGKKGKGDDDGKPEVIKIGPTEVV